MKSAKQGARTCLYFILQTACILNTVPYAWNRARGRLVKAGPWRTALFNVLAAIPLAVLLFVCFRLLQTRGRNYEAPRTLLMHIIWVLAFSLMVLNKVQLITRQEDMTMFTNALLDELDAGVAEEERGRRAKTKNAQEEKELKQPQDARGFDWSSMAVMAVTFQFIVNPGLHAYFVIDSPCGPQYLSSALLHCNSMVDRPVPLYQMVPYFLMELFYFTDKILLITFMWCTVFLRLAWNTKEMEKSGARGISEYSTAVQSDEGVLLSEYDQVAIATEYRRVQIMTRTLNDIYSTFLAYWPSLDYLIAAIMIFASIRFFSNLPFLIWLLHPACASRCFIEINWLMIGAAKMNSGSERYVQQVQLYTRALAKEQPGVARYLRKVHRSYQRLTCDAGSLYTFERTIVLIALHLCVQVVFNLLVAFPAKAKVQ